MRGERIAAFFLGGAVAFVVAQIFPAIHPAAPFAASFASVVLLAILCRRS